MNQGIMGNFATELKRDQAQGNLENGGKPASSFIGAVRSTGEVTFAAGESFKVGEAGKDFEVYTMKFRGGGTSQFIYVAVNGNENDVRRFYPSTLSKSRNVYDDKLKPTGVRKTANGKVCEDFQTYAELSDAMESLKGKTIKCTGVETIQTASFDGTRLINTQIPTFEYADGAETTADKKTSSRRRS